MGEPAKTLLPYLQRADELHTHDHLAAYYCRLYAMEKGLRIPVKERTSETKAILISLMSQLEKDKKVVKLSPDDNMYMEGFALRVFSKADKQDRAGRADSKTAMTFYAASIFFEVLLQFGELPPDIQEKQKYASWKAADIRKALAEGKKPVPGPPVDETNLEVDTTWGTEGTTNLAEQPMSPKDSTFIDDRNYTQSPHEDFNLPSAPSNPISPSYNAGYPPSYPHSASTPFDSLAGSPTTSGYNSFQQDAHQQQPHWPGSLSRGQPSESYQMNGSYDSEYKPSAGTIVEAHKASRFAVSALAFDDVPTAISHLRKSLELLTSSSATVD